MGQVGRWGEGAGRGLGLIWTLPLRLAAHDRLHGDLLDVIEHL